MTIFDLDSADDRQVAKGSTRAVAQLTRTSGGTLNRVGARLADGSEFPSLGAASSAHLGLEELRRKMSDRTVGTAASPRTHFRTDFRQGRQLL